MRLLRVKTTRRLLFTAMSALMISSLFVAVTPPTTQATLAGFSAGNIMDDGVMSNKSAMTEKQVQAFLDSKNTCKTNPKNPAGLVKVNKAGTYATGNWGGITYKYHMKDGKFICLADQDFDGESAARIIYRAGRDYSINPQVLIVLLEKENSLIRDNWPNYNVQYATATGYACPDAGPNHAAVCDASYYGFKNQVRQAAKLFHEVLSGGWTNYPVGKNYVQYNPSTSCGGSWITIKNRATSALYRYTPYQPNKAALKAGWGTAPCGAYGNRNFYNLFTEWFGSTTYGFKPMQKPRYMISKKDQYKTHPNTGENDDQLITKGQLIFFDQAVTINGVQYLRSSWDSTHGEYRAIPRSNLSELTFRPMQTPRYMSLNGKQNKFYPIEDKKDSQVLNKGEAVYFNQAITVNGIKYLRSSWDAEHDLERAVPLSELSEVSFRPMQTPRYMTSPKEQNKTLPIINESDEQIIDENQSIFFNQVMTINGTQYLRSEWDTKHGLPRAIARDNLEELTFSPMKKPRYMKSVAEQTKIFPITNMSAEQIIDENQSVFFSESVNINGTQYLRSKWDADNNLLRALPRDGLSELQYTALDSPRYMRLTKDEYKINPIRNQEDEQLLQKDSRVYFSQILDINGKQYLRSKWDTQHNMGRAVPITSLTNL